MTVTAKDGPIVRLGRRIEDVTQEYWPITLVAISGVTLTFVKEFLVQAPQNEDWQHFGMRWAGIVGLVGAAFLGIFGQYKRNGFVKALKAEIEEFKKENKKLQDLVAQNGQDYFEMWRIKLVQLHQTLCLSGSFRTSLYRFSDKSQLFYMVGRYAVIPLYEARGRSVYPAEGGCIGKAWASPQGEAFVDDLPPSTHPDYVRRTQVEWGLDEPTIHKIRMKCRSIYALALSDPRNMRRVAIVVFESLDEKAGDMVRFRNAIQGEVGRELVATLGTLQFMEPSPDLAKQGGF